tara:strand:+ start:704 stop:853 length:150 start_codon:yes stop_codon:yes gene_type:complete
MNNRFTDINVGYKEPDPDDKRTNEEVLEDLKKLGVEVTKSDKRPPEAFF